MQKNNNLLYLMIAILTISMGYFYVDKTNPEFFNDLLKKFSSDKDAVPNDETLPMEEMPDEKTPDTDNSTPEELEVTPDPEVTPPNNEPKEKDGILRRRRDF